MFLGTFFLVFTLSYIVLLAVDFLPEPVTKTEESKSGTDQESSKESASELDTEDVEAVDVSGDDISALEIESTSTEDLAVNDSEAVKPIRIAIAKIDKDIAVLNPTSRTIADLDEALLGGVVRHPDSATLAQEGNVFILGHSSYLPKVFNKNFQAFNGIQNLEWGDVIEVYSEDSVYKYQVVKVYRAKANDVTVPIAGTGKMLTLATCNSFGSTDDRYIVEAKQIEVETI